MNSKNIYWTLALVVIILSLGMIGVHWSDLPDQVPMHFNLQGEADRYGSKSELFLFPSMSIGIWVLFRWISRKSLKINPNKWGAKTPQQLDITKVFMSQTTLVVCIILALGLYSIMRLATGRDSSTSLMMIFTGISLTLLFIIYFVKLSKASKSS